MKLTLISSLALTIVGFVNAANTFKSQQALAQTSALTNLAEKHAPKNHALNKHSLAQLESWSSGSSSSSSGSSGSGSSSG